MTPIDTPIDLDTLVLGRGAHGSRYAGVCLLEAVAWFSGEPHTDRPACASRLLSSFGMALNDIIDDDKRQELRPLIPLIAGTRDDGHDLRRSYQAFDWLTRTYLPQWLDLAGLHDAGAPLRALDPLKDPGTLQAAVPLIFQAHDRANAARAAARAAAGDAAWDAAWDAAGDAAGDAARNALAPTVILLQDQAISLLHAMIRPDENN